LIDGARAAEPWAVLTGDSLFVGDIARPDLAVEKEDGARDIYRSLHAQLLALGDDVEVWPGHLGGSLCGGPSIDLKVSSTVGYERRHNDLLGVGAEDEFVARATSNLRPQPPNFQAIVALNRGPLQRRAVDAQPLTPRQIQQLEAPVIDVRTAQQFDDAHIPGAISNTILQAGFGTRLAWIAGPDSEVVLVGRDDADALHAAELAAAVGVGRIAGYLAGGMTSWREERLPVASIKRMNVDELHELADVQIVDVRERDEWEAGHIPGSIFAPYHSIRAIPDGLDPAAPVAVICASGQRAVVGASLIQRYGVHGVIHIVDGGVPAWGRAGYPIQR
jgi:rhodanese-related sulfurtransferase